MKPTNFYSCFGLRIRSTLPLPELERLSAPADDPAAPTVDIRYGPVPAALPGGRAGEHGIQAGDGEVLLTVREIARFLVRGGNEIVVEPGPGSPEHHVRLFLLGSAFGILCHQRGLLPLHANAIVANGEAFAFAGRTGAGKSTLAAHFQQAGYEVLCDDVCVVSFDADGGALAWPGLPRLRLWGDAAMSLGYDDEALARALDGVEKYHVPLARAAGGGPYRFRRLYLLEAAAPGSAGSITPLRGMAAVEAVLAQTYRGYYLGPMGLRERHLAQSAALLRHVEVYRASREWGYDVFQREAERLERHVLGG